LAMECQLERKASCVHRSSMWTLRATLATLAVLFVYGGTATSLRAPGPSHDDIHELSHNIDSKLSELTDFLDQNAEFEKHEEKDLAEANRFKAQVSTDAKQKSVDPVAAETALKSDEGPSDRVSLGHLEVAENTPSKTLETAGAPEQAQTNAAFKEVSASTQVSPSSELRFAEVQESPAEAPAVTDLNWSPPPIMQAELERPEDDPNGIYLNPAQDGLDAGEGWEESDNTAMQMSEAGGVGASLQEPQM